MSSYDYSGPGFQPFQGGGETSPFIQAVLQLLAHPAAHPAIPQGQHLAPPEGPLGQNAQLGWGQTPTPPRHAAPTRSKLGGAVAPGGLAGAVHNRLIPYHGLPTAQPHPISADIISRLFNHPQAASYF